MKEEDAFERGRACGREEMRLALRFEWQKMARELRLQREKMARERVLLDRLKVGSGPAIQLSTSLVK